MNTGNPLVERLVSAKAEKTLSVWTIYDSPLDYAGLFVVRRWEVGPETVTPHELLQAPTLDAARALIPPGLAKFRRSPTDPLSLVESWL